MGGAVAGRRLWDMGCSLGYNTFWFVDRGMTGTGIDIDPRNIALCREISRWTPGEARFAQGELTREMVEAVRLAAAREGLLLDPVYTGKAFAGLIGRAREGAFGEHRRILFVHTGGAPSLHAFAAALRDPALN